MTQNEQQDAVAALLARGPVVPVIVIDDLADAVPLARALVAGGLDVLEVTLRTPAALDAVRAIRDAVPEAVVGVGTVLAREQLDAAHAAGARFAVSPGVTDRLLDALADHPVPLLPGAATVSEVMRLRERGYRHQKFFPAEASGGAKFLASIGSVIQDVRFCPTGGVTPGNALGYLSLGNVVCVGGSWMIPRDAIRAGDWSAITALATEAGRLGR
jgi:2-dehydro-3-deoxyphosphogluconate aldolase/(4S)-4-hydroxy-2-oxoglutarate aldolase